MKPLPFESAGKFSGLLFCFVDYEPFQANKFFELSEKIGGHGVKSVVLSSQNFCDIKNLQII